MPRTSRSGAGNGRVDTPGSQPLGPCRRLGHVLAASLIFVPVVLAQVPPVAPPSLPATGLPRSAQRVGFGATEQVPTGRPAAGSSLPNVFGAEPIPLPIGVPLQGASRLGMVPKSTVQTTQKFGRFVDRVIDPEDTLDVIVGRQRVLSLKAFPNRYQIEEDQIVRALPLAESKQFSITGLKVGSAVLNLWFGDPGQPESWTVLSYLVRVLPDPEARQRLERAYEALAGEINRLFPNSVVRLSLAGDKLVVSGNAKDVVEAAQILRVVVANAPGGAKAGSIPLSDTGVTTTGVNTTTGGLVSATSGGSPTLANYQLDGGSN